MSLVLPPNTEPLPSSSDFKTWNENSEGKEKLEYFNTPKGIESRDVKIDYVQL
jgi:hypothetical protein